MRHRFSMAIPATATRTANTTAAPKRKYIASSLSAVVVLARQRDVAGVARKSQLGANFQLIGAGKLIAVHLVNLKPARGAAQVPGRNVRERVFLGCAILRSSVGADEKSGRCGFG